MGLNKAGGAGMKQYKNSNWLRNQYWGENKSIRAVAKECGCPSHRTIRYWMVKFSIPRRDAIESRTLIANHVSITKELTAFLNGLLLGDGHLALVQRTKKSARYQHTDKHREYLGWLIGKLDSFGLAQSGKIRFYESTTGRVTYQVRTRHYRELKQLRDLWYPNGKKRIPKTLVLDPITLKNWYIGDGLFVLGKKGTKKGEIVEICIEFDNRGKERMIKQLWRLGIPCSDYNNGIYIRAGGRKRFFNYMLSENSVIPPMYEYKFPEHYLREARCR